MLIEYCGTKEVECYRDFVLNPEDRDAARAFRKRFGTGLESAAKKLHDKLLRSPNALAYNNTYGLDKKNGIELKSGVKGKEPLVLKTRVNVSYRKFFNHVVKADGRLMSVKEWDGDFGSVEMLRVIAVNNHKYG